GVEECDDGNTDDGDGCSSSCLLCAGGTSNLSWTNGHCYSVTAPTTTQSWQGAETLCEGLGGSLISYRSAQAAAAASTIIDTSSGYWTGLTGNSFQDSWTWVTGEPFVYSDWNTNEPNAGSASCVEQAALSEKWSDVPCGSAFHVLCEQEPPSLRPE